MADAVVIGAGPNGLVAANVLADAGWSVDVLEAEPEPGGAVRTAELVEPGYRHDVFSAFYPLAAASPAFRRLELERYGLEWCHGPLVLAHPTQDGMCAVLSRDLDETAASLDRFAAGDGEAWRRLMRIWDRAGDALLEGMVTPLPPIRPSLRLAAAIGPRGLAEVVRVGVSSVRRFSDEHFTGPGAGRLLAGNALHADLSPESPPGAFFGWFLCALGQTVGYPFPRGGAGSLAQALVHRLESRGGRVVCDARVEEVVVRHGRAVGVRTADGLDVPARRAVLADVAAPVLYERLLSPYQVPGHVRRDLRRFHWDWATFKVDWTLDGPIPWSAQEARLAPVVHVTEGMDELTETSAQLARRLIPAKPFLVFGQYSMGDPTRSPAGKETAWAYTHVPHRVAGDAGGDLTGSWDEGEAGAFADRIEARVEALAPGFRALIRGRHLLTPAGLEARNANLVHGSLNGGTAQLHQQLIFRPTTGLGRPETPVRGLYLASAAAHPGGGVHGGPGAIAARAALRAGRGTAVALGSSAALVAVSLARFRGTT